MVALVERHLKAEGEGDVKGAVAVYTDDVVHNAVGFPGSPRTGKGAAREFYVFLTANFRLAPGGDRRAPTAALAPLQPARLAPDLVKFAGLESLAEPGHVRRGRFDGVTEDRGRQGGVAAGQLVEPAGSSTSSSPAPRRASTSAGS